MNFVASDPTIGEWRRLLRSLFADGGLFASGCTYPEFITGRHAPSSENGRAASFKEPADCDSGALGRSAFGVLAGLAALYIAYKYFQRHRLLTELRMARITVEELYQKQESGEHLMILDLRQKVELEDNPSVIRGALHMTTDEVEHRHQEIPRDRDIVLYCSCPNEVTSARVALKLHRKGISRVRPLLGGIDAWRERNYPTELRAAKGAV
jgi:rhodanese-related sulfurtransferase